MELIKPNVEVAKSLLIKQIKYYSNNKTIRSRSLMGSLAKQLEDDSKLTKKQWDYLWQYLKYDVVHTESEIKYLLSDLLREDVVDED